MIMQLIKVVDSLERFVVSKSGSERKIKYLRKQGVKIGERCFVQSISISNEHFLVEMGNHVAIANGVRFITHDGSASWFFREELDAGIFGKISIGNDVFIGMSSILLPNTSIGNNSIVGAGSVVRGKFPDNSVIMGNPAKVVLKMSAQKMLYKVSPGLCKTLHLNLPDTIALLKEKFLIG
jgi:acetyltransferase-like isoleucine patch superfamily enzyme